MAWPSPPAVPHASPTVSTPTRAPFGGDWNGGLGAPTDAIVLWEFDIDWTTPANSTFTLASTLPTAAFDSNFPCGGGGYFRLLFIETALANPLG